MLHYYFFKYWSRGLVGLMITIVFGYFGIFSYSLMAAGQAEQQAIAETALLSTTPPISTLRVSNVGSENAYKKSIKVFQEIQKLKDKKQDTTKLETKYADSVKNLSNQKPTEADKQLQELEVQIAKINDSLNVTPSPAPSGVILSDTPSPSLSPSPENDDEASNSAKLE